MTTQLIKKLSKNGIKITFLNSNGGYLCSLMHQNGNDFEKYHLLAKASFDSEFRLIMARKIIQSKIHHQLNLLKSYDNYQQITHNEILSLKKYLDQVATANSIESILGYEGRIAKSYFYYLGLLFPHEYRFTRRVKKEPKDVVNVLLNIGYTILYHYFIGRIYSSGLTPGFGFIHKPHRNHAILASDLMEEWRPIIIDEVIVKILNNYVITQSDFEDSSEEGDDFCLNKDLMRNFVCEIKNRMKEIHHYFKDDKNRYDFYYATELQLESLLRAIKENNPTVYRTIFTGD